MCPDEGAVLGDLTTRAGAFSQLGGWHARHSHSQSHGGSHMASVTLLLILENEWGHTSGQGGRVGQGRAWSSVPLLCNVPRKFTRRYFNSSGNKIITFLHGIYGPMLCSGNLHSRKSV